jgi:hypothetical protein
MLREESEDIKTYFTKRVLEELSLQRFTSELCNVFEEVAIEGLHITRGICLTKTIGVSYHEYDHYLDVEENTYKLHLFTDDYTYYRLDGIKAYEAFINGNLKKYLKNENMIDDTILKEYFGCNL